MALKTAGSGGPVYKWDSIGKKVVGYFLGLKDGKQFAGNTGKSKLATFKQLDGTTLTTGAPTVLAGKLIENVAVGVYTEVTFLGQEKGTSGVAYKNFKVDWDDERTLAQATFPTAPVQGANGTPAPAGPSGGDPVTGLEQKLRDKMGTQIGDIMVSALHTKYPDPIAYLAALSDVLKQNGAA